MMQTLTVRRFKRWPFITGIVVIALTMSVVFLMQSARAAVTSVTIGTSTKSLDGTNTARGVNQLILYTYSSSQTITPTNSYGIEVAVSASNVITAVNNRLQTGSTTGTTIPSGGYVLSGHGWGTSTSGYTWLLNNAQVGKTVVLNGAAPADTTAPTTSVTAPANNSTATVGDAVGITASASDNVGVSKVEFLVNGVVVSTDTSSPYAYTWSTAGKSAGNYTLTTKAYDAANNVGTSAAVTVALAAPVEPPVPADSVGIGTTTHSIDGTNIPRGSNQLIMYTYSAGQTVTTTNQYGIEVAVNASNVITAVNNRLQTGSTSGTTIPNGGYVLSGHGWGVSDSGYTWLLNNAQVGATVNLGGESTPADTTAPVTSITAPAYNSAATVGDTVTVAANASDAVGVTKVDFLVNGSVVSTDTTSPYSYAWNTTGKAAGNYTLATKAYDAAGNVGTSQNTVVTLNAVQPPADTTAPAVSLTAPSGGSSATVGDVVAIAANASDNVAVTKVEFLVDGTIVTTDTSAPYSYSWNTTGVSTGTHVLSAKAYDAAGNSATSANVSVTVNAVQTGQTATQRLWGQAPRSGKNWSSGLWTAAPFDVNAINQFENFRGSNVDLVTTYAPKDSPATMGGNFWSTTTWNGFQGKLNIGVPMAFDNGVTIQQVASGQYDAQYRALAQNLVDNGRGDSIIRIGWEANLSDWTWHATTSNADTWKSAWRHIAQQMKSVAPNLKTEFGVGCGSGLSGSSDRLASLTTLYPGDDLVDAVGCDVYDWWTTHPTSSANVATTLYRAQYGPGILDIIDFAKSKGKVAGFAEWGLAKNTGGNNGGGDNPYFIQAMYDAVAANTDTVAYELYFNEGDPYISSSLTNGVNPNAAAAYVSRW